MECTIDGIRINIYGTDSLKKELPFVILICDRNEGKETFEKTKELTDREFVMIALRVRNWNDDLSPWPAGPVFRGSDGFKGGADSFLRLILKKVLPQVGKIIETEGMKASSYAICGYSLAGLFALYSSYRCDMFSAAVSASGSLWYPGFPEFCQREKISPALKHLYLSLGDKESHTKNQLMARVEENTGKICKDLSGTIETYFEMNEGNHFADPELRTAKGIAWILNR